MAVPRITYATTKTIDLPGLPRSLNVQTRPLTTNNTTVKGSTEVIKLPRIDNYVQGEWTLIDSLANLLALENFWQWAQRGEAWSLALDSAKVVDTITAVDAAAGDTTLYVRDPSGITVGETYKLVDGPIHQLVTVSALAGDLVTISASLDDVIAAGAIFRDQFFYQGVIRDASAASPVQYGEAEQKQTWPPSRFNLVLSFFEVFNQEATMLEKVLSANASGTDVGTAQAWFPAAGGVSVAGNTTYFFEGELRISRSAGTSSHTTSLLFAGTATLTSILYKAISNTGDTVANIAENGISGEVATAIVFKAASTSATEQISLRVTGIVRINVAGTFIPQFQYSSAPGGAPSVLANTYFRMTPLGSGSFTTRGTWA